jgi:hypothetical protein
VSCVVDCVFGSPTLRELGARLPQVHAKRPPRNTAHHEAMYAKAHEEL